jgi:hypothetical protein
MAQARKDKVVKRISKRKQAQQRPVYENMREHNDWNPFERVDPAVIEDIHKRHDHNKIVHVLVDTEEEEDGNGQTL